ncbi:MAG: hypothetical protein ABSE41_07280 [Bacteroidota bacterium]
MHRPRLSILPGRTPFAAMLFTMLVLVGCSNITLISSYDETTDKGVTALDKSVNGLLNKLDKDPVPDYDVLKNSYDEIRADLGSLRLRNEARPKNTLTVKQLDIVKTQLDILENQHKTKKLNQAMMDPLRGIFQQTFGAILKLELEKKELDKKE